MDREEAINNLKKALGFSPTYDEAFYTLFPEFKEESEDERIRKALVWHLKADVDFVSNGVTKEECIAYLEKQKNLDKMIVVSPEVWDEAINDAYENGKKDSEKQEEPKWSPSEDEMGVLYRLCYISNQVTDEDDTELTRLYQDLKREYFNGHSFENMFPSEKQKERKPTPTPERIRPKFAVGDTICHPMRCDHTVREIYVRCADPVYVCVNEEGLESHVSFSEQDEWERKEQKPAEWSEEDEKMRNLIVASFKVNHPDGFFKANELGTTDMRGVHTEEIVSWLKSLRPSWKQTWKPTEKEITALENLMKGEFPNKIFPGATLSELLNKLKKLYYNESIPSWKPSEEQMKALERAVDALKVYTSYIPLISLLEQLQRII